MIVEDWLKFYSIKNYTINEDLSVDVRDDVYLSAVGLLGELPVRFVIVVGSFDCENNKLTSLEGFPINISGCLYCSSNKLTNLMGCPEVNGRVTSYGWY